LLKGIYDSQPQECGCEIRYYAGGMVVTYPCRDHEKTIKYICPSCGEEIPSKKDLKEHRWSHAL